MKSIMINRYGGPEVISILDRPIPKPSANEVLVKVAAAGINSADWHFMRGDPFVLRLAMGMKKPRIKGLGSDLAGTVVEVGDEVNDLKIGDTVFGDLSNCGFGAFADFVAAPATSFLPTNDSLPLEHWAAVPMASVTALKGLKLVAKIQKGEKVLVNGASGGVGSFAVQIAKVLGAHVTAVCSKEKMPMFNSAQVDELIDYKKTKLLDLENRYDVIFDAAAFQPPFAYEKLLLPKGRYVLVGGDFTKQITVIMMGGFKNLLSDKKFLSYLSMPDRGLLQEIIQWINEGKIRPNIDTIFPMSSASEAMQRMDARNVRGKILLQN